MPDIVSGAIQTLIGLTASTVFLLALFIGFCVIVGFAKFRKVGPGSLVFRNLVDRMGTGSVRYLTPDTPRGPADQLRTPELLEHSKD